MHKPASVLILSLEEESFESNICNSKTTFDKKNWNKFDYATT